MSDPYSPYPPAPPPPGHDPRGHGQPYAYPMSYAGYLPPSGMQRGGQSVPTGPSKAAACVMIALAVLALLLGALMILAGVIATPERLADAQIPPELYDAAEMANTDLFTLMRWTFFIVGGLALVYAVVMGGLSPSIWKGRRWAVIVALGLLVLVILFQTLNVLGSLGDPLSMCIGIVLMLPHFALGMLLILTLSAGRKGDGWTVEQQMAMQANAQQAAWHQYYASQQRSRTESPPPPPA